MNPDRQSKEPRWCECGFWKEPTPFHCKCGRWKPSDAPTCQTCTAEELKTYWERVA